MKVLMISVDPRILAPETPAAQRMRDYATLFDELHVIVFGRARHENIQAGNLFLYAAWGSTLIIRLRRAWRLARTLGAAARYDVITSQGADETGLIGFLLSRRYEVPFQLQIHTDILSPWYRRASWRERMRYAFARFLISRASCLRVASQRIKNSLIRAGMVPDPRRIAVLPIFTDTALFAAAAPDREVEKRFAHASCRIIAVGRLVEREKNFCMLINAMAEVLKSFPTAIVIIVGDGPDRRRYEEYIARRGLQKSIFMEPWRDDLASLLKSFDIFALSSHYEGWGMAVMEAMASGLAVVMTDVGLAGEVVRDRENGRVVGIGDTQAFAAALAQMCRDAVLRRHLAQAGQVSALTHTPKTKEEYLTLYKKSFLVCRR